MSELIFPAKVLEQHLVVLGKTGAGKSSALRHIVEHLLRRNKRVCIVDPKGDWWGLKWSADGKSAGFPIIAFGDFKEGKASDIPLNWQSGKHVAELVASGNRPCVIGFRGWMTAHMVRFWIDFASTLFNTNAGELFLVGDEFHNFAPKGKIMDPDAGKCLHWSNRLMTEGRGLGLVCLIASQRPQKVHNDTLTACETLVAMRVIHKADRDAVKDWIEGCGDMERGKEVLTSLAGMARGEAFVWSPEIGFGPSRIKFPMFSTFDSFAPPQLQKKVSASDWSNVDLEAVKAKLASVIEEHKQNDPTELKRAIAELRRELSQAKAAAPKVEKKEVPVLTADDKRNIDTLSTGLDKFCQQQEKVMGVINDTRTMAAMMAARINGNVFRAPASTPTTTHPTRPAPVHYQAPAAARSDEQRTIAGGLRRMMIALAQRPGLTKKQLGVRAGLSSTSGTFGTYLGTLRSNHWVHRSDPLVLTEEGRSALGAYDTLPEGQDLLGYWLRELGDSGAGRMLRALADVYPQSMTKEQLGQAANISATSGTFGTYLGKLRTLELVEGRSELSASKEFFG